MIERQKVHVLVVDDEEIIASSVAMILRMDGFTSEFYTNPMDALNSARLDPPNLLISDVLMPEMTGIELAIRVKEICPLCQVLLFSGQSTTADLLQDARIMGHEFQLLQKPIHPADLLAAIRETQVGAIMAD